jgi:FimV-like protein
MDYSNQSQLELFINFITSHVYILYPLLIAILISIIFSIISTHKKNKKTTITPQPSSSIISSQDIRAIAGEDMIATQLDLARAYIEVGNTQLAREILTQVVTHGNLAQNQEAEQLLLTLSNTQ